MARQPKKFVRGPDNRMIAAGSDPRDWKRPMTEDAVRVLEYINERHGGCPFTANRKWQLVAAQRLLLGPDFVEGADMEVVEEAKRKATRQALTVLFENGRLYPVYSKTVSVTQNGSALPAWDGFQTIWPVGYYERVPVLA